MEEQLAGYQRPAWVSVVFILLTLLAGFIVVGPAIGFFAVLPFVDGSMLEFAEKMQNPINHPDMKTPLYIIQSCATFFGLAAGPALYWKIYEKRNPFDLLKNISIPPLILLTTAVIVISFMFTNSVFIEWNANVRFPEFLKGFESWAKQMEAFDEQLVVFLTTFDSPVQFALAFLVIAVIAGFSEEYVFRGLIQPQLYKATHNIHAAIWISAFLFSALHLQFFGFVPRVLLGALFGYLYHWSGNLIVPMFAHALNNGISVVAVYLRQLGKVDMDIESQEAAPWPVVALFTVVTFGLLYYFYSFYKTRNATLT